MSRFSSELSDVEAAANATAKATPAVSEAAKRLAKSASGGDLAGVRRGLDQLHSAAVALQDQVSRTQDAWRYTRDQEEAYLADEFERDLTAAAKQAGFSVTKHERDLIVFPF